MLVQRLFASVFLGALFATVALVAAMVLAAVTDLLPPFVCGPQPAQQDPVGDGVLGAVLVVAAACWVIGGVWVWRATGGERAR